MGSPGSATLCLALLLLGAGGDCAEDPVPSREVRPLPEGKGPKVPATAERDLGALYDAPETLTPGPENPVIWRTESGMVVSLGVVTTKKADGTHAGELRALVGGARQAIRTWSIPDTVESSARLHRDDDGVALVLRAQPEGGPAKISMMTAAWEGGTRHVVIGEEWTGGLGANGLEATGGAETVPEWAQSRWKALESPEPEAPPADGAPDAAAAASP